MAFSNGGGGGGGGHQSRGVWDVWEMAVAGIVHQEKKWIKDVKGSEEH